MSGYNGNQVQSAYSNQNYMQNNFGGGAGNQSSQPVMATQPMEIQPEKQTVITMPTKKVYVQNMFRCCGLDIRCGICCLTCCEIFGLLFSLGYVWLFFIPLIDELSEIGNASRKIDEIVVPKDFYNPYAAGQQDSVYTSIGCGRPVDEDKTSLKSSVVFKSSDIGSQDLKKFCNAECNERPSCNYVTIIKKLSICAIFDSYDGVLTTDEKNCEEYHTYIKSTDVNALDVISNIAGVLSAGLSTVNKAFCGSDQNNLKLLDLQMNGTQIYKFDGQKGKYNDTADRSYSYKMANTPPWPNGYDQMFKACEKQIFADQCKTQVIVYKDWNKNRNVDKDQKKVNAPVCKDEVKKFCLYCLYGFTGSQLPRLYFIVMMLKWLCKGSATDEKEDRYDLVLGFTGMGVSIFAFAITPFFVGFALDFNAGKVWVKPMIFFLLQLLLCLYWRFVMIMYYDQKDEDYAKELELEEQNLNAKPKISDTSFASNAGLINGGSGNKNGNRLTVSRY